MIAISGDSREKTNRTPTRWAIVHPARRWGKNFRAVTRPAVRLLLIGVLLSSVPRAVCGQTTWEVTPYQLRVFLAMSDVPELAGDSARQLADQIVQQADSLIGAPWSTKAEIVTSRLRGDILGRMAELELADLHQDAEDLASLDKIILVRIHKISSGFLIQSRQLDCRSQLGGPLASRNSAEKTGLAAATFHAIVAAFTPIARIGRTEGKTVDIRLRAGALVTRSNSPVVVNEGAVLLPVFRRNDRLGNPAPGGAASLAWTYLMVLERTGSTCRCQIHSGLRNPLGGRGTGRTERFAVEVRPTGSFTRLLLRAQQQPDQPLTGYEVLSRDPTGDTTEPLGRTDHDGGLTVPRTEEPLRILYVKNGRELLARLPLVPGLERQATALVPDDDLRLHAEGVVIGLREKLVDLAVRREIIAARIRRAMAAGEIKQANKMYQDLRTRRSVDQFATILDREQQQVVSQDSRAQAKINSLFVDTRNILRRYADQQLLETLGAELEKARTGDH